MSMISIGNGFRFLNARGKKASLDDAWEACSALRTSILPVCSQLTCDFVALEAVAYYDTQCLNPQPDPDNPIVHACKLLVARQRDLERQAGPRISDVDFSLLIQIYPGRRNLLGRYFCSQRLLIEHLRQHAWCDDYSCWEKGPKPHGVAHAAWIERMTEWEEVMTSPYNLLNGFGVHICLTGQNFDVTEEGVAPLIPGFEARVARAVNAALFQEYVKLQNGEFELNSETAGQHLARFKEWHKSEAGLKVHSEAEPRIRGELEPLLTYQMLAKGAPNPHDRIVVASC